MLANGNPYDLVGPGREFGWDWVLFYPATSFVLVAPLAILREDIASAAFVTISVGLLVFGATRDSWHRLPAFASAAFVIAVRTAQWSPLATAAWFIPGAALAWAAKPSLGVALFLSAPSSKHRKYGLLGGAALLAASILWLPSWPWDWAASLKETTHMVSPIAQPGGLIILLGLLRWRRRDAAVLLLMALAPQSPSIYEALPILVLIPGTYREASVLSLSSSAGALMMLAVPQTSAVEFVSIRGALLVATTYLPALVIILRRPNAGQLPSWLRGGMSDSAASPG